MYLFRNIVTASLVKDDKKIGGEGTIVEIDESKFRSGEKWWILGIVERTKLRKCFFKMVKDRNAHILKRLIKTHVKPGSTIYTDSWKGYSELENMGMRFKHRRVNYKKPSKNQIIKRIHTQHVEGVWSETNKRENAINCKLYKHNRSGYNGIHFDKIKNAWRFEWMIENNKHKVKWFFITKNRTNEQAKQLAIEYKMEHDKKTGNRNGYKEEGVCPHYDHKKEVVKLNNRYNKQIEDITFRLLEDQKEERQKERETLEKERQKERETLEKERQKERETLEKKEKYEREEREKEREEREK
ncbi:14765_t:CDS:2, partial [Racocetra fulgida]